MAYHLVMPSSRSGLSKVVAFREWLLETAGKGPNPGEAGPADQDG